MKNALGREGGNAPYLGPFVNQKERHYEVNKSVVPTVVKGLDTFFQRFKAEDGMTFGFHHHLRNGDYVLNKVMATVHDQGAKDLHIAASSIFPCHEPLVEMMEDGTVSRITTSYMSGPVAHAVARGKLRHPAHITTHGGRARSILEDELVIDVAFVATPAITAAGEISGSEGSSACGSLGYAIADIQKAKLVVAITDNIVDHLNRPDIGGGFVDYIVEIDQIGDPKGIVSGTTQVTKDPIGLKIAKDAADLIEEVGLLQDGFSFQTGAGGISLAVAAEVRQKMKEKQIKGSFGCGGITGYFVDMLEEGLFDELADTQCFDNVAVASIERNDRHKKISANTYANPNNPDHYAGKLDCVILGASEIDLNYNVNVTTGSDGNILGGSGGHADTAAGAKLTIITTKLFNARVSAIVDKVRTGTTPGDTIDAIVTDYGIAINPNREDLLKLLEQTNLKLVTVEDLYEKAISFTGKPKSRPKSDEVIAYSVYRDGTILDSLGKI